MKIRDLGEGKWKDFMETNPSFRVGDVFVYRSGGPGFDYAGYTVAVYECYDETTGAGDICRKGIFWDKQLALSFIDENLITNNRVRDLGEGQVLREQLKDYEEVLGLISVPARSDGTYNRCREACGELARAVIEKWRGK